MYEVHIGANLEIGDLVIFGQLAKFGVQEQRTVVGLFLGCEIVAGVQESEEGGDNLHRCHLYARLTHAMDALLEGVVKEWATMADRFRGDMADARYSAAWQHHHQFGIGALRHVEEFEVGHFEPLGVWEEGAGLEEDEVGV